MMARRPPIDPALGLAGSLRRTMEPGPTDQARDPARIESLAFGAATIRSGGMAVATIKGANLRDADLVCEPLSPGFILDLLPHRAVQAEGEQLVLAMRVFRRLGAPRGLCRVRVSVGESSAVSSITVRV